MADNILYSNPPIDAEVYDVTIIKGDKGDKGDIGPTPAFSIGEVSTLEYDQPAHAAITGTVENPVLNLGIPVGVGAYTQAVEGGYTGDEEEFNSDLANMKTYAYMAEGAEENAETYAANAATSASAAAASAASAANSATAAQSYISDAADEADRAEQAANDASGYATNAAASASSAASSAGTATTKAGEAVQSANAASGSASTAATKAEAASTSASNAASSASAAATSATNAGASATAAASSAAAANTAKAAAETAQGKAEDAQEAAETAATSAQASADDAAQSAEDAASEILKAFPHDTASGSIANFPDGAALPVRDLTASITPIQDLNGYNNPWIGGAGKNKLPNVATSGESNGITCTVHEDGSITLNGTASATFNIQVAFVGTNNWFDNLPNGDYILTGCPVGGGASTYRIVGNINNSGRFATDTGSGINFTKSSTDTQMSVYIRINSGTVIDNLTFHPMIRAAAETDASYAPYENICPISGWTGATVTRTGKNLCDSAAFESGLLATAIGSDINAVTSSTRYAHSGIMPAQAALAVMVKTLDLSKINYASIVAYVGDKVAWTAAQSFSSSVMSKTWTIPANTYEKLRINIGAPSGIAADVENAEVQVELGSTATSYEPYQGETYSITFPTEAGTVYGGTLDVTQGKLTVDRAFAEFDGSVDEDWSRYEGGSAGAYAMQIGVDGLKFVDGDSIYVISNCLKSINANATWGNYDAFISTNGSNGIKTGVRSITTVNAWREHLADAPLQIVYYLTTTIVYDLDPVTIETLLGTNNIFADCGDTTVDYYADPTLFVNKKIAAAVAAMS